MKFFGYFSSIVAPVVRATIWLVNGLKSIGNFVRRVFFGIVNTAGQVLRAAWQHPIVTAIVGVTLGVAWSFFGWTPLLATWRREPVGLDGPSWRPAVPLADGGFDDA